MPDLVQTALSTIQLPGVSPRKASSLLVESINADLGTAYTVDYISKWRRGERSIPQPVQDWMLRCCIAHAIHLAGGVAPESDEQLDSLAAMLCPPVRK